MLEASGTIEPIEPVETAQGPLQCPLRLPEPAHTREFRALLGGVPKIADSLAEREGI